MQLRPVQAQSKPACPSQHETAIWAVLLGLGPGIQSSSEIWAGHGPQVAEFSPSTSYTTIIEGRDLAPLYTIQVLKIGYHF